MKLAEAFAKQTYRRREGEGYFAVALYKHGEYQGPMPVNPEGDPAVFDSAMNAKDWMQEYGEGFIDEDEDEELRVVKATIKIHAR